MFAILRSLAVDGMWARVFAAHKFEYERIVAVRDLIRRQFTLGLLFQKQDRKKMLSVFMSRTLFFIWLVESNDYCAIKVEI